MYHCEDRVYPAGLYVCDDEIKQPALILTIAATTVSYSGITMAPVRHTRVAFYLLLFSSILTLRLPDLWPVSLYLGGVFLLTAVKLVFPGLKRTDPTVLFIVPLMCVLPLWVALQLVLGTTLYVQPTRLGLLAVLSYCALFTCGPISRQAR